MDDQKVKKILLVTELMSEHRKLQRDFKQVEFWSSEWHQIRNRLEEIRKELRRLQVGDWAV